MMQQYDFSSTDTLSTAASTSIQPSEQTLQNIRSFARSYQTVVVDTHNSVINIEPGYEAIVQGLDHCLVALRDHSLLVCRLDNEQQIKHWVEKL